MTSKTEMASEAIVLPPSWRMLLANKLHWKDGLTLSEALTKAHATRGLLDDLAIGVQEFTYRKDKGEVRRARGTLKRGISSKFDNYERKAKKSKRDNRNTDGTYVYWDLDEEGFRSFKSKNLLSVGGKELPTKPTIQAFIKKK